MQVSNDAESQWLVFRSKPAKQSCRVAAASIDARSVRDDSGARSVTRESYQYLRWYLLAASFLPLPLAFLFAYYLRFESGLLPLFSDVAGPEPYWLLLSAAMVVWPLLMYFFQLADADHLSQLHEWTLRTVLATATLVACLTVLAFFFRHYQYSRLFTVLFGCVHFLLLVAGRAGAKFRLQRLRQNGQASRVLVVGTGEMAEEVVSRLRASPTLSCQVVGILTPEQKSSVSSSWRLQPGDQTVLFPEKLAYELDCDEIMIAVPLEQLDRLRPLLDRLRNLEIPTRLLLDLWEYCESTTIFELAGLPAANLGRYRDAVLPGMLAKGVIDFIFSGLVLFLLSPLFLLITVAIRVTMGRPILFSQQRVGLNGKAFRMLKFRTMRLGSQEESDTRWTTADDPRVTPLGRFLRRYNLDELPQFINVLKGEMSVVGPRPERPFLVNRFSRELGAYRRRHHFKVGITGWAQVNGLRGDTSIDDRLRYDLFYLQNWSFWFDMRIVSLTLLKSFRDSNAC